MFLLLFFTHLSKGTVPSFSCNLYTKLLQHCFQVTSVTSSKCTLHFTVTHLHVLIIILFRLLHIFGSLFKWASQNFYVNASPMPLSEPSLEPSKVSFFLFESLMTHSYSFVVWTATHIFLHCINGRSIRLHLGHLPTQFCSYIFFNWYLKEKLTFFVGFLSYSISIFEQFKTFLT